MLFIKQRRFFVCLISRLKDPAAAEGISRRREGDLRHHAATVIKYLTPIQKVVFLGYALENNAMNGYAAHQKMAMDSVEVDYRAMTYSHYQLGKQVAQEAYKAKPCLYENLLKLQAYGYP